MTSDWVITVAFIALVAFLIVIAYAIPALGIVLGILWLKNEKRKVKAGWPIGVILVGCIWIVTSVVLTILNLT